MSQYPSKKRAWIMVSLLCAAYVLSYVDRYILFLLVEPIKADMDLSDSQMGLLLGLAFANSSTPPWDYPWAGWRIGGTAPGWWGLAWPCGRQRRWRPDLPAIFGTYLLPA